MKKRVIYIVLLLFSFALNLNVHADDSIPGSAYVLPRDLVNKLLGIGVYRGYGMDRQDLGIYMPSGSSFKIRVKDNKKMHVELLNNNSATEKSTISKNEYEVSSDWVTIAADVDSVPFIKTPYSDAYNALEYEIIDMENVRTLDIFKKGDNEQEFIANWESNVNNFAVITDDYVTFLVPREDITLLKNIVNNTSSAKYPFTSINNMLDWYDGVIIRYNNYIGLSETASEYYNKNLKMKYFFKSNTSGIGYAAYHSFNYVYTNSSSISALLEKGWTIVHEIGHGFQSYYTWHPGDGDIILTEVENNFFAYEEEKKYSNEANGSIGIMYGDKTQQDYVDVIKDLSNFNELMGDGSNSAANAGARLFVFVNLFDKINMPTVMPYTLKAYRSIIASGSSISNVDLYGKYFSEASGYNVIPYLNYFKIYPSSEIEKNVYSSRQPIVYPLALVFNETTAKQIATTLNLRGMYSTVENNDVRDYISTNKITRDVKFKINTENVNKLNHKKIFIKNSNNEIVRSEVLQGDEITIKNLPVGMYYVDIASGSVDNLNYLLISQQSSDKIDLAPTGTDGSSNQDILNVNLDYTYDPNAIDDQGQVVDVPNTGVIGSIFIVFGMILIASGIGVLVYKKNELF